MNFRVFVLAVGLASIVPVCAESQALGAPTALKDIGMKAEDLDRAADLASANPYWNPRPIERAAIRRLLDDAFYGRRPNAGFATTKLLKTGGQS